MRQLETYDQSDLQLVKLEECDLGAARAFVLSVASGLSRPEFFITSDIDSIFERLVCREEGLVYAFANSGQIVAMQAIDVVALQHCDLTPRDLLSSVKNCYESTLTLCRPGCRRKGYSSLLHGFLLRDSRAMFGARCQFATVHPDNTESLMLYSTLGYTDIGRIVHFGLPRRLLHRHRE